MLTNNLKSKGHEFILHPKNYYLRNNTIIFHPWWQCTSSTSTSPNHHASSRRFFHLHHQFLTSLLALGTSAHFSTVVPFKLLLESHFSNCRLSNLPQLNTKATQAKFIEHAWVAFCILLIIEMTHVTLHSYV